MGTGSVRAMPGTRDEFTLGISFSGDGKSLISARGRGIIQIWDVASGRERVAFRVASDACCVGFSSDGRFVAMGGGDATVRPWDLAPSLAHGLGEAWKRNSSAARR